MIPENLYVWLFDTHIGILSRSAGKMSFIYDASWLNAPSARALSQSLPLRTESFNDRETDHLHCKTSPRPSPKTGDIFSAKRDPSPSACRNHNVDQEQV